MRSALGTTNVAPILCSPLSTPYASRSTVSLTYPERGTLYDMNLYTILKECIEHEQPVALASLIRSDSGLGLHVGEKMLVFPGGKTEGGLGNKMLDRRVIADALDLLALEKSKTLAYEVGEERTVDIYIESILPPPPLIIIGADPDAVPIVSLAKQLGFKVVVVDHRENYANPEKYPEADLSLAVQPEELAATVRITDKTFVLVKTHNYLRDKEILKTVCKSPARYVGQLGPKARMQDLLKDMAKDGLHLSEQDMEKLYAPVGLDIGAESPEQIAMSVLAEMLAVKNGRRGGFLKDQVEAIHPRT